MRDLKFGVEIEFFGANYVTVIEKLRAAGISVADFSGYTHKVIPQWKLTTDASVTSQDTGLYRGLELVSPILYGDEGLDELQKVYEVLNSCGAKVDKTCGTHVHFDIADFTVQNCKNFLNLYYNYQNVINYLVPPSRRRNEYCKPLRKDDLVKINQDWVTSISDISYLLSTRYRKVNLRSYIKYGTIEIRQHGGTTEFDKMEAWIILMYQLLDNAKSEEKIDLLCRPYTVTQKNLNRLLKTTNLDNTCIGDYLTTRFNNFKEVV